MAQVYVHTAINVKLGVSMRKSHYGRECYSCQTSVQDLRRERANEAFGGSFLGAGMGYQVPHEQVNICGKGRG
jgi:hypothetical protein